MINAAYPLYCERAVRMYENVAVSRQRVDANRDKE